MIKNYDNEIQLLSKFAEYQSITGDTSLERFGVWLLGTYNPTQAGSEPKDYRLDGYIGMLIAFMGKYANFYARRIFGKDGVYSIDDYGLLLSLQSGKQMSKSELMKSALLEKSYGTEVIKRLLAQGFIVEIQNTQDKRERLVSISSEGLQQVVKYREYIQALASHVVGKLDNQSKVELLKMLQHLHEFHYPYFTEATESDIRKLLHVKE